MKVFGLHVLLVLLLLPSATAALPSATAALQCEHPGRGVCDPDGLLSVREAKQLTAQIVQLEEQFPHDCGDVRRGFQVAVHIIQKLPHGTKKREHARDLFNRHGVGYQLCSRPCTRLRHRTTTFCEILQSNNGLLLLLAVDDRKATIHTGKGTQRVITDLMVTDMLAATGFKQQMRAHDYAGGVQYILDQIAGPLQQNQPTEHYKRRHEAAVSSAAAAVAAAAAAAVSASSFVISTNSSPSISILDSALALFFFFLFFGFGISAVRGHWQSVQPLDSVASFGGEDGWGGVLIVVLVMCLGMCEVFRYSEYVGMVVSAVAGAAAVAAATETTTVASFAFVVLACLRFAYFEWHKFKRDGDFRAKLQRLQDIRVKQLHRRELCKGYTRGRNAKRDGDVTWAADPAAPDGSLRQRYAEDFRRYDMVQKAVHHVTNFFTLNWFGSEISMYAPQTGTNSTTIAPCAICLEELPKGLNFSQSACSSGDGEFAAEILRCGHVFHEECIDTWVNSGGNDGCPICRKKSPRFTTAAGGSRAVGGSTARGGSAAGSGDGPAYSRTRPAPVDDEYYGVYYRSLGRRYRDVPGAVRMHLRNPTWSSCNQRLGKGGNLCTDYAASEAAFRREQEAIYRERWRRSSTGGGYSDCDCDYDSGPDW